MTTSLASIASVTVTGVNSVLPTKVAGLNRLFFQLCLRARLSPSEFRLKYPSLSFAMESRNCVPVFIYSEHMFMEELQLNDNYYWSALEAEREAMADAMADAVYDNYGADLTGEQLDLTEPTAFELDMMESPLVHRVWYPDMDYEGEGYTEPAEDDTEHKFGVGYEGPTDVELAEHAMELFTYSHTEDDLPF
jgi:hypothetical protein